MLKSRLPQIIVELKVIADEVETGGAAMIKNDAKTRVQPHRLSGRLEDAIHTQEESEGTYVVAGGKSDQGDDVFWGHMLEHGTSHSAPHPFLVPAVEENRDPIERLARGLLRRL